MVGYTIVKLVTLNSIFTFGVIGNVLLFLAISKLTSMRKMTRKLIINLVVIGFVINVIKLPNRIIKVLHPDSEDTPYLVALMRCEVVPYIANLLTEALINTIVALTIDRYIAFVHPFRDISERECRITLSLIWGIAAIFRTPQMLVTHLNDMNCQLIWPSNCVKHIYFAVDTLIVLIVPACILIYCYVIIWRVIKDRRIPGETIGNERLMEAMEVDRINILKTIFVVTMYFVFSVLVWPLSILIRQDNTRQERDRIQNHLKPLEGVAFWLDCLGLTHIFMSPLLLCLTNSVIRNSIKSLVKCSFGATERNSTSRAMIPTTSSISCRK